MKAEFIPLLSPHREPASVQPPWTYTTAHDDPDGRLPPPQRAEAWAWQPGQRPSVCGKKQVAGGV